jgi:hypothetical protein
MDPEVIIESYVGDVMRHLPRRRRHDVGFELRSLLIEDLHARAADSGRTADEAMAIELLTAFGRPQEVADRYRPAGFTVIRPADAPRFARVALGGVVVQWAITLPAAFAGPAPGAGVGGRLATWWLTWGLGSFWWPGFLITMTLIAAAIGRRRAEPKPWTPRRPVDRDHVNRPALVLALTFWMAGATVLIALPWLATWAPDLPRPLLDAFAFDPDFLRRRAPWVLPMWTISFGVLISVLLAGRWGRVARRIEVALNLAWLVLLIWWLAAGRIFQAEAADGVVKLSLLIIVVMVLVDLAVTVRRSTTAIREPVV